MWPFALVVAVALTLLAKLGVFDRVARAVILFRAWLRAADDQLFGR